MNPQLPSSAPPPSTESLSSMRALGLAVLATFGLTGLIWALGPPISEAHTWGPHRGNFNYRWVLDDPTVFTRSVVWGLYAAHQLTIWGLIYHAQRNVRRYTNGLHRVNILALAANGGFALLHIAQTHWLYDGLAQDVHEISSLASVAVMLILILLMENHHRGLFFGVPAPLGKRVVGWLRRYHGYYFSWAITYTFWYHPAEITQGHLAGFAYLFLIMVQSSLFFTRAHLNRWWKLGLESLVVLHSGVVAYHMDLELGRQSMGRFVMGFLAIFVVTQIHGVGLSRAVRAALIVAYGSALVALARLGEPGAVAGVYRIPAFEYLGVFLFAGLIALGLRLFDLFGPARPARPGSRAAPQT